MAIVDLHCDTISAIYQTGQSLLQNSGHFDLQRARSANICLQVFALFASPAEGSNTLRQIMKQLDYYDQQLAACGQLVYPVLSSDDLPFPGSNDKIACLLHLEGADALGTDPEVLRLLYRLGLRSLGLTWNHRNLLADGVGEGEFAAGLSKQGRKMIKEVRRLNMILDLAHAGLRSFFEAIDVYKDPLMVSHANARRLCDHPRNLNDDQLRVMAQNNGIIGVNLVRDFVGNDSAGINDLLDHVVYISELIGARHVALGSDFDGASDLVLTGIEGYTQWELLLERRGFSKQEQEMILRGNACRLFAATLKQGDNPNV